MSLCITQEEYKNLPLLTRLEHLHAVPKQLYFRGDLPKITIDEYGRSMPRILTIVGSRKCTRYGKQVVKHLLSCFSRDEVIIISGLAFGIDSAAHEAALDNDLITIAIPGSGLGTSVLYPHAHKELAEHIINKGGALISELDDTTKAAQWTFPARNRIMAALSDVVLIIEAEEKSGTLITARQALELGKDIGAVPGEIFSPTSQGTLTLIKEGAAPVASTEDLRELLHLTDKQQEDTTFTNLPKEEQLLLELLNESRSKDELFAMSGLSMSSFMTAFSMLEVHGYIEDTLGEIRKIV